jgi:hypothetical protein
LFASCNHIRQFKDAGSGNVTTENRTQQVSLKVLEASNTINLVIEQAECAEVTVEADDNLQNHITTKVEKLRLLLPDYTLY